MYQINVGNIKHPYQFGNVQKDQKRGKLATGECMLKNASPALKWPVSTHPEVENKITRELISSVAVAEGRGGWFSAWRKGRRWRTSTARCWRR